MNIVGVTIHDLPKINATLNAASAVLLVAAYVCIKAKKVRAHAWLIIGQKLFLFYSDDRREKFAANPNRVTGPADHQWPAVARTLTP